MIKINIFLDYKKNYDTKKNFIKNITKNIRITSIGYAGFKTKKYLENHLTSSIFGCQDVKDIKKFNFDKNNIKNITKNIVNLCNQSLPLKDINIFIFPCFNLFVKKNMKGVSGYSPWKNTILIYINPINGWENKIKGTIAHEYNHSVIHNYHKWETLLDSLIFEGLAEHFREKVVRGKKSLWVKSLSKNKAIIIFNKIEDKLNSRNQQLYYDLFFGSKKYPLWSGYSIGYYIVEEYLKKEKNIDWKEIVGQKPKEILGKSGF